MTLANSASEPRARLAPIIVPLLLLGIIACYALSWVWSAQVLMTAPPLWSVAIRLTASLGAVLVLNVLRRRSIRGAERLALPRVLVLSVLGFAGFFGLTYLALADIPASLLVLVLSTIPIMTLLQGRVLFGMAAGPRSMAGILCIGAAIALFARQVDPASGSDPALGIAFGLAAAVGYSFYGLLYKKWAGGVGVMDLLPWLLAPSAIVMALVAFHLEGAPRIASADISALATIGALIAAPVYFMYNALILRAGPLVAGSISVAAPITTFTLESLMIRQQALGPSAFALVLIGAAGVALLVLDGQRKDTKK